MRSIRYLDYLAPFVLIALCVASERFLSPVVALAVFIFTLVIFVLLRYDSRLFVGTAIFLLIVSAGFLAIGSTAGANAVAVLAYYFLTMGVLGLLVDYLREARAGWVKRKHVRKDSAD